MVASCKGDLPVSAAKLSLSDVRASSIRDAMTGALADLIEEEVAGGNAMLSLGAALRLSSQYWPTAGRLTVVVLLVWLSVD